MNVEGKVLPAGTVSRIQFRTGRDLTPGPSINPGPLDGILVSLLQSNLCPVFKANDQPRK